MMFINLEKIDSKAPAVVQWENEANKHRAAMKALASHEERSEYLKKNPHWGAFKEILKKIFGEKCWYSECAIDGDFGDVDHFRPKNKSTDESGVVILKDGYWWLAYDYNNYRLSCAKCNRPSKPGGKIDIFPIKAGTSAAVYPNSNDENILLDPCKEEDCDLIDCNNIGMIIPITSDVYKRQRVETSVLVYNLDKFNSGRKRIKLLSLITIMQYGIQYVNNDAKGMKLTMMTIKKIVDPKAPFSSFARKCIQNKILCKPYKKEIQELLKITL